MVGAFVAALTAATPASGASVNPAWNVTIGGQGPSAWYFQNTVCQSHPASSRCEKKMIDALDGARESLGKRAYRLPKRFGSLAAAEQLLVLVNDDRHLYGLPLVRGLNTQLNAAADDGAKNNADPGPYGGSWVQWDSNWAGGMASPLFAYYGWMYADGLNRGGSRNSNLDCSPSNRSGCWGHRDNVLRAFPRHSQIALGIGHAHTSVGSSWSQLFEAFTATHHIGYLPTVTGLTSRSGPSGGGGTLTLSGYGFYRVSKVRFGRATATITRRSGTHLTVRIPRHRAGGVHVVVTTVGGSSHRNAAAAYRYR